MNYDEMSDEQLTERVSASTTHTVRDITDPSDIMPIAIEYKISLIKDGEWFAHTDVVIEFDYQGNEILRYDEAVQDKNPYRAIAICFLKMTEAK